MVAVFPNADDSVGAWRNQVGATTNLFQSIDEGTADDVDFIESDKGPNGSIYRAALSDVTNLDTSSPFTIDVRLRAQNDVDTMDFIVRIKEGASTVIAERTYNAVTSAWVTQTVTLSLAEKQAITDGTNLFIEIEATQTSLAVAPPEMKVESKTFFTSTVTDGSTQDITIPGFGTPKGVMFLRAWFGYGTATEETRIQQSVGFYDGTNQASASWKTGTNTSSTAGTNTMRAVSSEYALQLIEIGNLDGDFQDKIEAVEMIEDGVRIRVVAGGTGWVTGIHCVFFGGDAFEDIKVATDDITTIGTGTVTTGNRMDVGIFTGTPAPFNSASPIGDIAIGGIGFAAWNGQTYDQVSHNWWAQQAFDDGQARASNTEVMCQGSNFTSGVRGIAISEMTPTGFKQTGVGSQAIGEICILSMQLANGFQGKVVEHDAPDVTGNFSFNHGVAGGIEKSLFMLQSNMEAYGVNYSDGRGNGMALAIATREGGDNDTKSIWTWEDGSSSSDTGTRTPDNQFGTLYNDAAAQIYASGAASFADAGVTANFTQASGTGHIWPGLHLLEAAPPTSLFDFTAPLDRSNFRLTTSLTDGVHNFLVDTTGQTDASWDVSGALAASTTYTVEFTFLNKTASPIDVTIRYAINAPLTSSVNESATITIPANGFITASHTFTTGTGGAYFVGVYDNAGTLNEEYEIDGATAYVVAA